MNKILYCILHTQNQNDRVDNILDTWGKSRDVMFYSDEENLEKNIRKVSDRSDYDSAKEKQINVFKILSPLNYEWYFFCDNDTFVNVKLLESKLDTFDKNLVHCQVLDCFPQDPTLRFPSGGAGFLIHRDVVAKLVDSMRDITDFSQNFSDVTIGLNLRDIGVGVSDPKLFFSQRPEFYNDNGYWNLIIGDEDMHKYITFHYISEKPLMERYHSLCQ